MCIDISTPRNIDPGVRGLPGIVLHTIDDLSLIVSENLNKRKKAVADVERIIDKKMDEFHRKMENNRKCQEGIWPVIPFHCAS